MICKNCHREVADNAPNCPYCGLRFIRPVNNDYQQEYYKRKIDRQDNAQQFVHNANANVKQKYYNGKNTVQSTYYNEKAKAKETIDRGKSTIDGKIQNIKDKSQTEKNGDTAYILSIVALIVGLTVSRIAGLVMGIIAMSMAKKAYDETNLEKYKTAKTLGLASIIVSSLEIAVSIISLIIYFVAAGTNFMEMFYGISQY